MTNTTDPSNPLSQVVFFGARLPDDVVLDLQSADIDTSIDQVTQLTMRFLDENYGRTSTGYYNTGLPVAYENYRLEVAASSTGQEAGVETVSIDCRPRAVRLLKSQVGNKVLRNVSPTDFVRNECSSLGIGCVGQESARRLQVARDVRGSGVSNRDTVEPSSWSTFQRLAKELNFLCFESGDTIYFGTLSWLIERGRADALRVEWRTGFPELEPIDPPACRKSVDSKSAEVEIELPVGRARWTQVGKVLYLNGVPGYTGFYLITRVNFSLLDSATVHVVATNLAGTAPDEVQASEYYGSRSLRPVLQYAGFRNEGLEIAIGVVMAESAGIARLTERGSTSGEWGQYVGLFQIRALRNPEQYEGIDHLRDASLLTDPIYNAQAAFQLTNGGTDWSAWSSYTTSAYKQFYRTGRNYLVYQWTPEDLERPEGVGGNRNNDEFVSIAITQAVDNYLEGAEAMQEWGATAFQCAELVKWAATQTGVFIPALADDQIAFCVRKGYEIDIERAVATKGALLHKPGTVAISLGNGSYIEAIGSGYGVRKLSMDNRAFKWLTGGLIPGMKY